MRHRQVALFACDSVPRMSSVREPKTRDLIAPTPRSSKVEAPVVDVGAGTVLEGLTLTSELPNLRHVSRNERNVRKIAWGARPDTGYAWLNVARGGQPGSPASRSSCRAPSRASAPTEVGGRAHSLTSTASVQGPART